MRVPSTFRHRTLAVVVTIVVPAAGLGLGACGGSSPSSTQTTVATDNEDGSESLESQSVITAGATTSSSEDSVSSAPGGGGGGGGVISTADGAAIGEAGSATTSATYATSGSVGPRAEDRDGERNSTAPTVDSLLARGEPLVLAHSGGENAYPAETMYALKRSVSDGVDMLDFNVQLSADGVLVVFHDDTVDRRTDGTGLVAELTADELSELDAAYYFHAECGVCTDRPAEEYPFRGVRHGAIDPPSGFKAEDFGVATLADVLVAFPAMPLNIEVKGGGAAAEQAVGALADELETDGRLASTVFSSFDDEIVAYALQRSTEWEVSPGLGATGAWVLESTPLPEGMRILQLPPVYEEIEVITPELIEASHEAGYLIWVWPNDRELEDASSYRSFLQSGIDGLNINEPAIGVEVRDEYLSQS